MTDPWLVILVGSPIVLLISPSRPILSWQVPVVTAAVAGAMLNQSPDDSSVVAMTTAVLNWFISLAVFFSPGR